MIRRILLSVAGLVAVAVGAASLFAPVAFHRQYGISIGADANLLSETRAAGGAVLAVGVLLLVGAFVARLAFAAALSGAVFYLAYALARGLSVALDGTPAGGLVLGGVVELVLGLACGYVLYRDAGRQRPAVL
ncbi:DUF4345 family protein [Dactylosporangium siamense]|uniref:DUF4345 domain-containing protein n=1 Tax=Dactylosporangium siamense TaxID=685454 RepID=A0A919PT40_9ACTN|nr:DUF4345 family protein [Dactylosporangium siamense]GIG49732.1 hypothetical protein Dsi01nite_077730 [Dactylosporangium siamense]